MKERRCRRGFIKDFGPLVADLETDQLFRHFPFLRFFPFFSGFIRFLRGFPFFSLLPGFSSFEIDEDYI